MKAIWKFPLEGPGRNVIQMPLGAKVLCAQNQHEKPTLWAMVESEDAKHAVTRVFFVIGTGHEAPMEIEDWTYIDTVQMAGGSLVWHVFEV